MSKPRVSREKCRWGILGTAQIARKNWCAMRMADNATLVAVASRTRERSRQFIQDCQTAYPFPVVPVAVKGYRELLEREDIDAVYVPLPTGVRKRWIVAAAECGKHVLCEKPCAVNLDDLDQMLDACRKHGVQFMDAVMFMHSHRLEALRKAIDDPAQIGQLRRIESHFSFLASDDFRRHNIRVDAGLEPLGCAGDLGWYNIRLALWILKGALPHRVRAHVLSQFDPLTTGQPVPAEMTAELSFDGNISAGFYCGFESADQQTATISGSAGYVQMEDFVLPFVGETCEFQTVRSEFVVDNCRFEMRTRRQSTSVSESANNAASAQETRMIRNFSEIVNADRIEESWYAVARGTQIVLDACMKSASMGGQAVGIDRR